MSKVKLLITEAEFNSLHEAVDTQRKPELVKVNRQALVNLLIDHSNLLQKVQHATYE